MRHVICATVGSWNFVSPKITPARGPSKEGRGTRGDAPRCLPVVVDENPGAARWLAGTTTTAIATTTTAWSASLALPLCKRADRRRQSVNRAHTWPIAVRYMHLYGVYPKTRASLVVKKRDGCCGRFRAIRHYQANARGKLTIASRACKLGGPGDRRTRYLCRSRSRSFKSLRREIIGSLTSDKREARGFRNIPYNRVTCLYCVSYAKFND